jgi:membrane associated rhomboid family serine protease
VSRDEVRHGLLRLAAVTLALVFAALLLSTLFLLLGAHSRGAVAAGAGVVGTLLVFAGVGSFAKASPVRHVRSQPYDDADSISRRRETERLALGLFAFGVAFNAAALALG